MKYQNVIESLEITFVKVEAAMDEHLILYVSAYPKNRYIFENIVCVWRH